MSSNGDPVVSVVVVEDAVVVVASDDNDNDSAKHCGKRQCTVCCKWYSGLTNALGWKAHMKSAHGITGNHTASSASFDNVMFQSTHNNKPMFPKLVLCKYENVVVDYIVEGGITLRAAGGVRFKKFVVSLTNEFELPSARMILRQIVELYRILEPLLAAFLCSLDITISLTLDG
ncbi:unnamed protein product [Sphagnum tenellum]